MGQKLHPLHSVEFITGYVRNTGEYFPTERCTGRTTILALGYIQLALTNPGKELVLQDHHGTRNADRELCRRIRDMVEQLRLDYFKFKEHTIQFG